jgi:hypothetical protein
VHPEFLFEQEKAEPDSQLVPVLPGPQKDEL